MMQISGDLENNYTIYISVASACRRSVKAAFLFVSSAKRSTTEQCVATQHMKNFQKRYRKLSELSLYSLIVLFLLVPKRKAHLS